MTMHKDIKQVLQEAGFEVWINDWYGDEDHIKGQYRVNLFNEDTMLEIWITDMIPRSICVAPTKPITPEELLFLKLETPSYADVIMSYEYMLVLLDQIKHDTF
jgi:hypothetical protein